MELSYNEISNALEAVKTAFSSDKTGGSIILLIGKVSDSELTVGGLGTGYCVAKKLRCVYSDTDVDFEIIVNYKKFAELVSMTKPSAGLKTNITLELDAERKELVFGIVKYIVTENTTKPVSKIKQRLSFINAGDDKHRRGGLIELNTDELFSVKDDSLENENTSVWEKTALLSILSKFISGDAIQVFMSNQSKAIATNNSGYAVYKEDPRATVSITLSNAVIKNIITVLKTCNSSSIVLHAEENYIVVGDTDNTFGLRASTVIAKQSLLNQINGLKSADYAYIGAMFRKDIMQDMLKCFTTVTGADRVVFKFVHNTELDDWTMLLFGPDSTSRFADLSLSVDKMTGITDMSNKEFELSLSTFSQMLTTCDEQCITLNIAVIETGEGQENYLLNITSVAEDGSTGIKCYAPLE